MQLFILRHGTAEDYAASGGDKERALIEKGYKQSRSAGALLKEMNTLPDIVLTSPYKRTVQTAETFCEAAGLDAPLVQPWLASGMRAEIALTELQAFKDHHRVMIVGHEPDLSGLIEWLLGANGGAVEMKKGSLACIEMNASGRRGQLLYLVPPAVR